MSSTVCRERPRPGAVATVVALALIAAVSPVTATPTVAPSPHVPARSATAVLHRPVTLPERDQQALSARYGRVLSKELGLLQALDGLGQKIDETEIRLQHLAILRASATDALREAEVKRARCQRRQLQMRLSVQARLRALIRVRHAPPMLLALSAQEFSDQVHRDRLLTKLVQGDVVRLAAYRKQVKKVERVTTRRNEALDRLDELDRRIHGEKAALERKRHEKLALVTQIKADPVYNERARRDQTAANGLLLEKIQTLRQWQERRYAFGRTRGKLLSPVNIATVEVPFGPRRHPRFGSVTFHRGVDLRPKYGSSAAVRSVFWGRVAFVGWLTGYGDTVILDHGKGWHSVYAHLRKIVVSERQVLRSRARIGEVGDSGSLKGRYLYFEIRENGKARNPRQWFR
jgi:septal ring factor EnvC (AmiA/AmiB activator)